MVVHGDYTTSHYKVYPNFNHPKLTKVLAITKYLQDGIKKKFNVDCELCYNPLVLEPKQERIVLVSATRLNALKGAWRMKKLAERLDLENINYVWYVFTNDNDIIGSPNVCFIKERLNVYKWIQEADYLVQLSDTEACSYSINEAMAYGTKAIVTPLPYLEEIGINESNAIICNFDMSNIDEVVEKIKQVERVNWKPPKDNYMKYLVQSKSTYKEMKTTMKKIRAKRNFRDLAHDINRRIGDIFFEEDKRADQLINGGWAVLLEDIKEEKAVKKEPKEIPAKVEAKAKAVAEPKKEKAVKRAKK